MDEPTRARLRELIAHYRAQRDEALAQANQAHGAAEALQAWLDADPPPPGPVAARPTSGRRGVTRDP